MIIRVQTDAGQWRVDSITPSSTVRDILSELAAKHSQYSCGRLTFDQRGERPIAGGNTLEEHGLRHGSMIYCRVAEVGPAKLSTSSHSGNGQNATKKRSNQAIDLTNDDPEPRHPASGHRRLPMGTFGGAKLYRNSLHPGETFDNDHVTLANLIPADCDRAIVTTFESPELSFVEETFNCNDLNIADLLVVRHDMRKTSNPPQPGHRVLGEAEVTHVTGRNGDSRSWHNVTCAPHTGGSLHGKLLLFRSRNAGLRVVVSGNNFAREQWGMDRDALWVQDFPFLEKGRGDRKADAGPFEGRLVEFVERIATCRQGNHAVQQRVRALFEGVDFSGARGRLVYSFPASKEKRGGWKQLANAVRELRDELDTDLDSDTDSSLGDNGGGKKPHYQSGNNDRDGTALQTSNHAILNAASGCMGNLKPDFLLQMHQAMRGDDRPVSKKTEWEGIFSPANAKGNKPRIGLVRCMWPSPERALTMSIRSVCCGRGIDRKHWNSVIPQEAKSKCFFDAPPNPPQMGLPHFGEHARTHGKVMYMTIPTSSGCMETVLYVGSHNFSQAAWGVHGIQPANVEIGVVLATSSPTVGRQWRDRLPCILPGEYDSSPSDYAPAYATEEVKKFCAAGRIEEAKQMFRNQVARRGRNELIDLCDSD